MRKPPYLQKVRKVNQHKFALGVLSTSDVQTHRGHLPGDSTLDEVDAHREPVDLHCPLLVGVVEPQRCHKVVNVM